jgi:hypothetical protein
LFAPLALLRLRCLLLLLLFSAFIIWAIIIIPWFIILPYSKITKDPLLLILGLKYPS